MKAIALLSGGLDSTLAVKLIIDQGIEVEAVNFVSPFCLCNRGGRCHAHEAAEKFGVPLKVIPKGEDYLELVSHPRHGHGSGMNPCIDCRIYMLRKAKQYAEKTEASFIFTGEVLGQRPMSQHRRAMQLIDREAGLEGKVLRPLSAKLLPETEAEAKGWVDRTRLMDIRGRSRKPQMKLAQEKGITDYPCPAGGCLLTQKEFAEKVSRLLQFKGKLTFHDVSLLKIGRHFWMEEAHVIVGRNEFENRQLLSLSRQDDCLFEVPNCGSPVTLLEGQRTKETVEKAAWLTARYSKARFGVIPVKYGKDLKEGTVFIEKTK